MFNQIEYNREYYRRKKNDPAFKESKRKSARKYYSNNKEKYAIVRKKYNEENREAYNLYRNNWRKFNPRGIYDVIKQSATKRNLSISFSRDEFEIWWNKQKQKCFYCDRTLEKILLDKDKTKTKSQRLTIDRKNNDVGYSVSNIVLCCYRCNCIKGDFFSEFEMLEIGKIIKRKC